MNTRWSQGKKRRREIKLQASFEQKEKIKKLALCISLVGKDGKSLWTMSDVLEAMIRDSVQDRLYITSNQKYFHPQRPYTFENSTYFAALNARPWKFDKTGVIFTMSVRLDVELFAEVQRLAYSLDMKVAQVARKIVEDFLSDEARLQTFAMGFCSKEREVYCWK